MTDHHPADFDKLKATFKQNGVILPHVERHVLKQRANEDDGRASNVIHPSELAKRDWCGRHDFYRITGVKGYKKKTPSYQLGNVFDFGHDVHDKYQGLLWDMGVLWGKWRCLNCQHEWYATSPYRCVHRGCPREFIAYAEVPLEDPDRMIYGNADGLVVVDEFGRIIEVKTIGLGTIRVEAPRMYEEILDEGLTPDEIWWRIKRPFPGHLKQGLIYGYLLTECRNDARVNLASLELPPVTEIVFIYESKMTQATKEFVVKYNRETIEHLLSAAKEVRLAVVTNTPPDRPAWAEEHGPSGKVCKACEYRKQCWNTSDPEEEPVPLVQVRKSTRTVRRKHLRP